MRKFLILLILPLGMLGCESAGKKTAYGAGIGAAAGAIAGAVIGHQSGNRGKGAAIGAAIGGLSGGTVGNYLDKQAAELAQIAETKRTENGIITKLKGDILFPSGQAGLNPSAQANIQKISDIIAKYPEDIVTVLGHTDATGSDQTNQALSQQRANAVRTLMVSRGVASVTALGMGETKPVATNDTEPGRSQNRRVEIQIRVDESKIKKK